MPTLFTRCKAQLAELAERLAGEEAALGEGAAAAASLGLEQLRVHSTTLAAVLASLAELQPNVAKLKAKAEESDPNRTIYAPAVAKEILAFAAQFADVHGRASQLQAPVVAACTVLEEQAAADEAAAVAAAAAAAEAAAAKAAAEAAEKAAAEKAAVEKAAAEKAAAEKAAAEAAAAAAEQRAAAEKAAAAAAAEKAKAAEDAAAAATAAATSATATTAAASAEGSFALSVIFVGTADRKLTVSLPDGAKATVLQLKTAIAEKSPDYPAHIQLLICAGRKLDNSKRLEEYSITPSKAVHVAKDPKARAAAPAGAVEAAQGDATQSLQGIVRVVFGALSRLKAATNQAAFVVAARTLVTLLGNALDKPDNPQFRRIRLSNTAMQARLLSHPGGLDALRALGFGSSEEEPGFLVFQRASPHLEEVRTMLNDAIRSAATAPRAAAAPAAAAPQPAAAPNPWGAPNPAAAPFGQPGALGVPGMAGLPSMGEMMNNPMMQHMMSNPEMVQAVLPQVAGLMQNPQMLQGMMQQMGGANNPMMQQMMSSPGFAQSMQHTASMMQQNPALFAQLMSQMPSMVNSGQMPGMGGMGDMFGAGQPPAPAASPGAAGQPPNPFAGMGGMGAAGQPPNPFAGMGGATPAAQPAPAAPAPAAPPSGTPTTAEEEDAMLQEAIRLSMGGSSQPPGDGSGQQPPPSSS